MTKAELVSAIAKATGIEKANVLAVVEGFMEEVMNAFKKTENEKHSRRPPDTAN